MVIGDIKKIRRTSPQEYLNKLRSYYEGMSRKSKACDKEFISDVAQTGWLRGVINSKELTSAQLDEFGQLDDKLRETIVDYYNKCECYQIEELRKKGLIPGARVAHFLPSQYR